MRVSSLLFCFALTLSGCCSWDYEELKATRNPDDRREALACLAEDALDGDVELANQLIPLCERWISDRRQPDPAVRATAMRVLRALRAKEAADAVQRAIPREPVAHVREEGVVTLAALAGTDAEAPLLARMANDPSADVRMASARELTALAKGHPTPALTEAFIARLGDAHVGVRLHARRALRALYPKVDQGLSAQAWRGWLEHRKEGRPTGAAPDGPPPVPGAPAVPDGDRPPPVPPERPKPGADRPPKPPEPGDFPFPDEPLDAPEDAPPKPKADAPKPKPKAPKPEPDEPPPPSGKNG